ncbi:MULTISPECIES: GUN4 domain-containing protein [Cyanophyceae]|uniref:GUN4 domain-containing protein n=1 Tax=Cyanophyceae TaxID=3028117 RepID=UPI0016836115|nr:GUN4 domain-containing protein [Trichocoleus sp. FACHB-69]MBD1932614.1 GUN4 domain-containing protein [Trichocoleus sp. FACHB-69]
MVKNWAVSIGINKYDFLQPLNYAQRDAQLMQEFLCNEAGFNQVLFFSDDSPDKRPSRSNLLRVLRQLGKEAKMSAGDNFWFFFSGHGMRHEGRDYLMPLDGDANDIENTAISITYITDNLRLCGADNVVLIFDACRNQGTRSGEGIGNQTAELARQTGVLSIFSCSPNEYSYEIEALQQGAFTRALLEGLGVQGKCATVERLNQYLSYRLPEINRQHGKPQQTPYSIAEPITKSRLIVLPRYATLADIAMLKNDAYQAEVGKDIELAKQLWLRVNIAAAGRDLEAVKALERIAQSRMETSNAFSSSSSVEPDIRRRSSKSAPLPESNQIESAVELESATDALTSEHRVDYTLLQNLLASRSWKEADRETKAIMLEVAGRKQEGWLGTNDIRKFPYQTLHTIDQLWVTSSNGRFGFSVQQRIWQELGGTKGAGYEIWVRFANAVGWRVNDSWVAYKDLPFALKATEGNLPYCRAWVEEGWPQHIPGRFDSLVSRFEECKVQPEPPLVEYTLKLESLINNLSSQKIDYTQASVSQPQSLWLFST